jgi:predicted O-methyltransferase YrrM
VLEIGTHSGGATRAIHKGMQQGMQPDPDRRIVTVDITKESDDYLKDYSDIVKITGDANDLPSIVGVLEALGDRRKIEILFIDADHTYLSTTLNYSIYTTLLRPSIVVVDDVNLNDEMIACWKTIRAQAPEEHSANVEAQLPDVREASAGFGLQVLARNIGGEVDPVPIRAPNFLKSQIKKTWKLLISGRYQ